MSRANELQPDPELVADFYACMKRQSFPTLLGPEGAHWSRGLIDYAAERHKRTALAVTRLSLHAAFEAIRREYWEQASPPSGTVRCSSLRVDVSSDVAGRLRAWHETIEVLPDLFELRRLLDIPVPHPARIIVTTDMSGKEHKEAVASLVDGKDFVHDGSSLTPACVTSIPPEHQELVPEDEGGRGVLLVRFPEVEEDLVDMQAGVVEVLLGSAVCKATALRAAHFAFGPGPDRDEHIARAMRRFGRSMEDRTPTPLKLVSQWSV